MENSDTLINNPETKTKNKCDEACTKQCGLFDFMANTIGIRVLHPGGYVATEKLCSLCQINENSHVLDLACGVGTTSAFLSKQYQCRITGIDRDDKLIEIANERLGNLQNPGINFEVGDALSLPFEDNSFDVVIAQAFLILIDDKEKALDEIYRVLKPDGYFGSLELGWFKSPTKSVYDDLVENACSEMIPRMLKFEEWESFFSFKKLKHIQTYTHPMPAGMGKLLKAEGFSNFIRIMFNTMSKKNTRKKMMKVQQTFARYNNYFGYGIFCFQK